MHTTSGTTATILAALALIATALSAQQAAAPAQTSTSDALASVTTSPDSAPVRANSKVRIVRLSEVKGEVQLDRNAGQGFENAMTNIPIIEHARLQTGMGVAEVEFEDNSTLRLTPDSLVEFPQLELLPSGAKASTVNVLKGMVYVSLLNTKDNELILTFGQQKIHLQPSSHVRLQLEPTEAKLTVFDGVAQVEGPSGTMEASKKKTVTFDLANQNQPVVAKNAPSYPLDSWDHDAAEYHKRYASLSALASSPYNYGVSDMLYYGSFVNTAQCGSMWRPYFVSAAWDPFANGTWAWYPGAGYSWVSPYPWGWMPFHYGGWTSCPGAGWGWQPGGSWYGLNNAPASVTMNHQPLQLPRPPLRSPVSGNSTLVPVNLKPLTSSTLGSHDTFVFRNDSAGLGIPRGSLGKLDQFSEQAVHRGSVSAAIYPAYSSSGQNGGRTVSAETGPSPRPGYVERSAPGSPSMSSNSSMGARNSNTPAPAPGTTTPGKPR